MRIDMTGVTQDLEVIVVVLTRLELREHVLRRTVLTGFGQGVADQPMVERIREIRRICTKASLFHITRPEFSHRSGPTGETHDWGMSRREPGDQRIHFSFFAN
jgi:hypothetical protein